MLTCLKPILGAGMIGLRQVKDNQINRPIGEEELMGWVEDLLSAKVVHQELDALVQHQRLHFNAYAIAPSDVRACVGLELGLELGSGSGSQSCRIGARASI